MGRLTIGPKDQLDLRKDAVLSPALSDEVEATLPIFVQPEPIKQLIEVIKEVEVLRTIEVPVEVVREVIVEVPVETIKIVERIKEVKIEVPVEVVREVRVEVPVEKIVRIPVITVKHKLPRWSIVVMLLELMAIIAMAVNK